jgi:hypothetical protein
MITGFSRLSTAVVTTRLQLIRIFQRQIRCPLAERLRLRLSAFRQKIPRFFKIVQAITKMVQRQWFWKVEIALWPGTSDN